MNLYKTVYFNRAALQKKKRLCRMMNKLHIKRCEFVLKRIYILNYWEFTINIYSVICENMQVKQKGTIALPEYIFDILAKI